MDPFLKDDYLNMLNLQAEQVEHFLKEQSKKVKSQQEELNNYSKSQSRYLQTELNGLHNSSEIVLSDTDLL